MIKTILKVYQWLYDYTWDMVIGVFYGCVFLVGLRIIDIAITSPYIAAIKPDMIELRNGMYYAFKAYADFDNFITQITKFSDLLGIMYTGFPLVIKKHFTGQYRVVKRYH